MLTVHQLTPTVYWVEGGIGNCGFIIGEEGVIVVDATMTPEGGQELLANIARITPKPVTTVILTHGDLDHIGGLAAFPAGLTIIAQENTRAGMEAAVAGHHPMISPGHLPGRRVSQAREVTEIEGVQLELFHWAPAHTSGDLVVYLRDQKIVFTGDIFTMDQYRTLIHLRQNGSSAGWLTSAKGVAALDANRFVVGHGAVQSRGTLLQRIRDVEVERDQIIAMVTRGMNLQEIQAVVGDPPPGQDQPGAGGPRFDPFSEVVYRELAEESRQRK